MSLWYNIANISFKEELAMSCITCSSFDPNFHNGYCDYHKRNTSPNDTCDKEDCRGGKFKKRTCSDCESFDSNFHNGYCNYHRCDTYSSSSCSNYS